MSENPPAGYYADPSIPGYIRYWDGSTWVAGTSRPAPDESGEDARASSSADAWRPSPEASQSTPSAAQQPVVQQQAAVQQQPAVQQPIPQQAVPEQFQQQYVPQQYTPPQPAQQPYQQQAAAQIPQQFQQQPAPAPMPGPQIPQQYPAGPQAPYAAPAEELEPQRPATVAGMIVPSAFTARQTGTFPVYSSAANPFAGLPGSPGAARAEGEAAGEVSVLELATPGSRFLARIIDLGIAAVFSAPITVSLLLLAHRHDHQYVLNLDAQATTSYTALGMDAVGIALWGGAAAALVLVAIMYEGYRLGRGGQTAGKRLAGIRVVRLSDAHPIRGGGTGIRRALIFWVLAVLPLVDLVALGGVLWGRPYRQGLHERVTATATVKV